MENQISVEPALSNPKSSSLTGLVKDLSNNLSVLKPDSSETAQLITYALVATAVVGIMVYHYIRDQEH